MRSRGRSSPQVAVFSNEVRVSEAYRSSLFRQYNFDKFNATAVPIAWTWRLYSVTLVHPRSYKESLTPPLPLVPIPSRSAAPQNASRASAACDIGITCARSRRSDSRSLVQLLLRAHSRSAALLRRPSSRVLKVPCTYILGRFAPVHQFGGVLLPEPV